MLSTTRFSMLTIRSAIRKADDKVTCIRSMSTGLRKGLDDILATNGAQENPKPFVVKYGDHAFQINNVLVRQSVILLPNSFLLWNARSFQDITVKSLALFPLLYPTLEVLFIGCGERIPSPIPAEITTYFRKRGIVVEATSTMNAASTYNLLSAEGRNVAAALLTLQPRASEYNDLK